MIGRMNFRRPTVRALYKEIDARNVAMPLVTVEVTK